MQTEETLDTTDSHEILKTIVGATLVTFTFIGAYQTSLSTLRYVSKLKEERKAKKALKSVATPK